MIFFFGVYYKRNGSEYIYIVFFWMGYIHNFMKKKLVFYALVENVFKISLLFASL